MVITLTPTQIEEHCQSLAACIRAAGFEPMLLIGIKRGGAEVARLMRRAFADSRYCEVQISRPSSSRKRRGLQHTLLRKLPLCLCNLLRVVESRFNEWRLRFGEPLRTGSMAFPDEIDRTLSETPGARILLVDDAIDTGATVHQVLQYLESRYPGADVRVAVISVTAGTPFRDADYCIYHDRTLCRFPWSNDYKPQKPV